MPTPFYIVQSWYEPDRHPFFHETNWTQTDMAKLGEDIAEGQFGTWRFDAVKRYDPATERMADVTAEALNAAIDYAERQETWLPNNIVDAAEHLNIVVPNRVLHPERRPELAETYAAFRGLGRRAA